MTATAVALLIAPFASGAEGEGSISGTVTAEGAHAPLAGVDVCALGWELEELEEFCTRTDGAGEYTLAALPSSPYTVEFLPAAAGLNYVSEEWDDKPIWLGDEIDVGSEPITGVDAELAAGGEIHGRVVDAGSGAPLQGVSACAASIESFSWWNCARTGSDGRYAIVGNAPGLYEVTFYFGEESVYLSQTYNGHIWDFGEADLVSVGVGAVTANIDAALARFGRIRGRVTDATTRFGAGGVEVCARRLSGWQENECSRTGPDGEYMVDELPPDTYRVTFGSDFPKWDPHGSLEEEVNPFRTQYFNNKVFPDEADLIGLGSGATLSGIDAALVRKDAQYIPPPLPVSTPGCKKGWRKQVVKGQVRCRKILKCRKGKKKRVVKGKQRCVRVRREARRTPSR